MKLHQSVNMQKKTINNFIVKKHNEGVSLVELLVAMAVGAIVLSALIVLIQQSVQGYNSQTTISQLQNDANITLNQIEDNVMEANLVAIYAMDGGADKDSDTEYFATKSNVVYKYDKDKKILYLANGFDSTIEGYLESVLCENVESFKVRIMESSFIFNEDINKTISAINKPIRLSVLITLGKKGKTRDVAKEINVRNSILDIELKINNIYGKVVNDKKTYNQIEMYLK